MSLVSNIGEFDGFATEDFEAYAPEKWNSKMFTLPRRKVKGKLEYLGDRLGAVLKESGFGLTLHLSDEFPSLWNKKKVDTQWLFFSRDDAARQELSDLIDKERSLAQTLADPTPLFRHMFFGMAVKDDAFELGIWLHHDAWVDRKNLSSLLATDEGREAFAQVVNSLPAHYELGLVGGAAKSPSEVTGAELNELATSLEVEGGWLFFGARMPADQVVVLGSEIAESADEVFRDLGDLYRHMAWSPDNDAISLDNLVQEHKQAIQASHEEFDRERQERERQQQEKEALGKKLREEVESKVRDAQAWRQREQAVRRAAAVRMAAEAEANDARAKAEKMAASMGLSGTDTPTAPAASAAPAAPATPAAEANGNARRVSDPRFAPRRPKDSPRSGAPSGGRSKPKPRPSGKGGSGKIVTVKVSAERAATIEGGDGVEIVTGFLRGRMGVVQEIDDKGRIRVNFGAVSSWIDADDVAGRGPLAK